VFGDPLETLWKNCIFGLCGDARFERRMFGVLCTRTPVQRAAWLAEVAEITARHFPPAQPGLHAEGGPGNQACRLDDAVNEPHEPSGP
jgi:hypothetical protein